MRLPLNRVYRAFPELDRFTNDQCEQFVRRAWRRAWWRIGCLPFVAGAFVFAMLLSLISRLSGEPPAVVLITIVMLVIGLPVVSALLLRDALLRHTVGGLIGKAVCIKCGFSLLGLRVADGVVRCPECGRLHHLKAIGLTPADLIAHTDPATPRRDD
jgi:hypothetical protein